MTRTTHPAERKLARAIRELDLVRQHLPRALDDLGVLAADGFGAGAAGEHVSGGDVPSSTMSAALSNLARYERYRTIDSLVAELAGHVAELLKTVTAVPDPRLDTAADAEELRCSGGEGDWADATCTKPAVRHVRSENRGAPSLAVCWACLKRRQRVTGTLIAEVDAQPGA